jgi:hypothetical protein
MAGILEPYLRPRPNVKTVGNPRIELRQLGLYLLAAASSSSKALGA